MLQHLPLSLRTEHKTKNSSFKSNFFSRQRSTFEKSVKKKEEKSVEIEEKRKEMLFTEMELWFKESEKIFSIVG